MEPKFKGQFDLEAYPSDRIILEYLKANPEAEIHGTLTRDSVAICFHPDEGQLPVEWEARYYKAVESGEYIK